MGPLYSSRISRSAHHRRLSRPRAARDLHVDDGVAVTRRGVSQFGDIGDALAVARVGARAHDDPHDGLGVLVRVGGHGACTAEAAWVRWACAFRSLHDTNNTAGGAADVVCGS